MGSFVWLRNPDTGAKWESPADYAHIARLRGWEDTDAPEDPYADAGPPAADEGPVEAEQTGFDPAVHTVAEVKAHIEKHQEAAPGEVERVIEAERAGKHRTTITGD